MCIYTYNISLVLMYTEKPQIDVICEYTKTQLYGEGRGRIYNIVVKRKKTL